MVADPAEPAVPVTLPFIAALTVKPVSVPTDVMLGCAAAVTVAAEPVTLPLMELVTVNPVSVPTDVILG